MLRRHQIVHDGDYMSKGVLRGFDQGEVTEQAQTVEKFVVACDEMLFPSGGKKRSNK